MHISNICLSVVVALLAFVSITNGKNHHEIRIDYYMSIVAISCSNPGQYAGRILCDQAGKLQF
jgi:hypothetical protein